MYVKVQQEKNKEKEKKLIDNKVYKLVCSKARMQEKILKEKGTIKKCICNERT
jgi:hypothetical protein